MDELSQADDRALDARCRLPTSPASRAAVVKLRALPPDRQAFCIARYALCDLPHLVRCALEAGVSADSRWGEHDTPALCLAAEKGGDRAMKALLTGRANVALADRRGATAVHKAALHGSAACLRLLIEAGAQLDSKMTGGFTPLHGAAQEGHAECCSLLLAAGCDATERTACGGDTALHQAVVQNHSNCARVLLPASDLSLTNLEGRTALHACIASEHLQCFELLLPLMSDVDVRSVRGLRLDGMPMMFYHCTPLHLACSFGQERMVKALLSRGASRTARDSKQRTPLHAASLPGHLGCVTKLLGKPGAYKLTPDEVNAVNVHGHTPLHSTAHGGHAKVCGVLCAAGARLDAIDAQGLSPLMTAQREHSSNTALLDFLAGRGPAHAPGTVCDECGRPEAEVRLAYCTGCLRVRYCGSACAVAAWPAHRAECQRVRAAREKRTEGTTLKY